MDNVVVVTGLTADRMRDIEAASVVDGNVVGNDLVLVRRDGQTMNAGSVRGNPGAVGPAGGYYNDITVDSLPATGIISAHRSGGAGGSSTALTPEETIEGAWIVLGMGAHILDIDANPTANGDMAIMHDDTVDRTTLGSGPVSSHFLSNMPPINPFETVGGGWGTQLQVPTLPQFLSTFGGKCVITIEAKGGVPSVKPLADIIKARGLANSVFINTNDVAVVTEIVAQGVLAHLWAWNDITKVGPGISAGASLIEVPYNATPDLVAQCATARDDPTKKLRWFIAGPISTRTQYKAITPGIMGHVSDAIGNLNRPTGDAPLVTTIKPSLLAGKRGVGWRLTVPSGDAKNVLAHRTGRGIAWNDSTIPSAGLYLGDMSGTMPGSYGLQFRFIPGQTFTGPTPNVRFRFASTIADGEGLDSDSNGYVVILNADGRFRLYSAGATTADASILLYENTAAVTFLPDTEYVITATVTPTTVKVYTDGPNFAAKSSPVINNSAWRGGHFYIWRLATISSETYITDFTRI
jgi:hypothetical protein